MRYLVIIAKGKRNYSAYSPDVLGCVSTGKTREDVEKNMQEALQGHIEWMLEDGDPLPMPHTSPDDPVKRPAIEQLGRALRRLTRYVDQLGFRTLLLQRGQALRLPSRPTCRVLIRHGYVPVNFCLFTLDS